jgi:hypothetical protein
MQKIICFLISISIIFSTTLANGEDNRNFVYPEYNNLDNGSRLGVTLGDTLYWDGMPVIKVSDVAEGSGLYNIIKSGDYIYSINGFSLRSADDIYSIIRPLSPGSMVTVYFLEADKNNGQMMVQVATQSSEYLEAAKQNAIDKQNSENTDSQNSGNYCGEHMLVCALGSIAVVGVASAMIGSSPSSESSSNNAYDFQRDFDENNRYGKTQDPAPDVSNSERSYGLYGDCPLAGAGYNC